MKKIVDKLVTKIKFNKKMLIFLLIIFFIALVSGSLLVVLLDKSDKITTQNYLNTFITDISQHKIDYLTVFKSSIITNLLSVALIWLLGISIIGIPIILFIFFAQAFTLGFSIASLFLSYKFKGLLLSLIYLFPNSIIYFGMLLVLVSYSMILSIKLITTIIKKKQLDFKIISSKYVIILIICAITTTICSLFETFALPNIIKLIAPILK